MNFHVMLEYTSLNDANNPRTKVTCEKRFTCKMFFCLSVEIDSAQGSGHKS